VRARISFSELSQIFDKYFDKYFLTTPIIIDIWEFAFEGGEILNLIIKDLEKEVMKKESAP
jgi:hypothetical protein